MKKKDEVRYIVIGDDRVVLEKVLKKLSVIHDYIFTLFAVFTDEDAPFTADEIVNEGLVAFDAWAPEDRSDFHIKVGLSDDVGIWLRANNAKNADCESNFEQSPVFLTADEYLYETQSLFVK